MENTSNQWWVLAAVCLLTVILNIDAMAVNVAIPKIASQFQTTLTYAQWILNAYVLFSGIFTILGGVFGMRYGNRRTFLFGVIIFVLASCGAAVSFDIFSLTCFRAIQGFALGMSYPVSIVLAVSMFPHSQKAYVLGYVVGTMGFSLGLGPIIGGIIVHYLNWRFIFFINLPIGLITLIITLVYCKKDIASHVKVPIDYLGGLLMIGGFFLTLFALNQVQNWGFASLQFWGIFILGVILLCLLYFVDRSKKHPFVYFQLLKSANYNYNLIIRLVTQIVFGIALFFFPLMLQNLLNYSPLAVGLQLLYITIICGLCSPVFGKFIDKRGHKVPSFLGNLCYLAAAITMLFYNLETSFILPAITLFLVGLGTGILFVSTSSGMLSFAPKGLSNHTSGLFFTLAWLDIMLGLAIAGFLLAYRAQSFIYTQLQKMHLSISNQKEVLLKKVATGIANIDLLKDQSHANELTSIAKQAFIIGFHGILIFWIILAVFGMIAAILIKEKTHFNNQ